ncbi:MAG: tagaturonate reductase [Oscillospiraceae bacterium]|nr:tagaturonate reductase [Oscillospiraceae bacterium]
MDRLSYNTLEKQNYQGFLLKDAPVKVLQFGEGNFLRAFVDYFFDLANEKGGYNGKVAIVQPIPVGRKKEINDQDGLYTVYLRGLQDGEKVVEKRIVSSIATVIDPYEQYGEFMNYAVDPQIRFVVSNTTEAGIAFDGGCAFEDKPAASFPGKVTQLLYERYQKLGEASAPGFVFLSCELIDHNGDELKRCVNCYIDLWKLPDGFKAWVNDKNVFCSTMVDRIVTGYPRAEADALNAENGYLDANLDTGEIFAVWYIEGPQYLEDELPFKKVGLPIVVTPDCRPFKQEKVRILNGVQTTITLAAYLAGNDIMRFALKDPAVTDFARSVVFNEIIPTLPYSEEFPFTNEDLCKYAEVIFERLNNPFIDHQLMAISLNTTAKWKARVLPSLLGYQEKYGNVPAGLILGFCAYLCFYHGYDLRENGLINNRDGKEYLIQDDRAVLEFYFAHKDDSLEELAEAVCARSDWWGLDLREVPTFMDECRRQLRLIEEQGMQAAIKAAAVAL